MSELVDSAWAQYEMDGDKGSLTTKRVLFFRSIFVPSLACGLNFARTRDGKAIAAFGDELERRLKRRLEAPPAAMHSFVQTLLLAKTDQS